MKRIEPTIGALPLDDTPEVKMQFEKGIDELPSSEIDTEADKISVPASLASRNWAKFIDMIITALIFTLSLAVSNRLNLDAMTSDLVVLIPGSMYFLLSDALFNGQSIGKKLFKIAVVSRTSGNKCSAIQSIVRNLLLVILGPFEFQLFFSKRKRRFGDNIASTIVIQYS
ncbi:MAG: RDD family protein [Alteromonadales bacterium]|nr:RDD family protein [Alteromonadales bacterium]